MNITPVNNAYASVHKANSAAKKGKNIGTAAGLGVSGLYMMKNAKPTFAWAAKEGLEKLGSKNKGLAYAGLAAACVISALTLAGRVVGGVIGKIVDVHNQNKEIKNSK